MNQDSQTINCIATEQSPNARQFSAEDLATELNVTVRAIYKYAKTLIAAWHWLPESAIRSDGNYTQFALDEMQRLKGCKNAKEYTALVAKENQKPVLPNTQYPTTNTQPQTTALTLAPAQLPTRYTDQVESKLATLQQNTAALNLSIQDRIALVKQQMIQENSRANNNRVALNDVRKQQLIAEGVTEALEDYQLKKQAYNATLEQLTLEELQ
jgi:hypothetical protein